ncbi:hypothetical protein [Pseudomonas sp. AU8050]|uniref:hypothetical protein n=1 Tax=Pseudomonas sp. AU8050 TaxID=2681497 RepID=UPI00140D95EE|nr:hypothetical protein [Pseudomonas sp. AU8050]NHC53078.1 hypothetical protein [Pseudomonas sp. AU8050]
MNDYIELKKQAEAARDNCPIWYAADSFSLRHMDLGDSGFVAEADPRTVLALIADNEALRKEVDRLKSDNRALLESPGDAL